MGYSFANCEKSQIYEYEASRVAIFSAADILAQLPTLGSFGERKSAALTARRPTDKKADSSGG